MMNDQKDFPIDNDLFQFYIAYEIRRIRKSMDLWDDNSEKVAIINVLENCQSVDGNTLRAILNDVFNNSFEKFTCNEGDPGELTAVSTGSQEDQGTDNYVSAHEYDNFTLQDEETEDPGQTSDTATTETKPKSKSRRKIMNEYKSVLNIFKPGTFEEIISILSHVERSKAVFYERMKTIESSFEFNYTFPTKRKKTTSSNCKITILEEYDLKSTLGQCQLNMICYRIGKIVQNESSVLSPAKVIENRTRYYDALEASTSSKLLSSYMYPKYCRSLMGTVDAAGAYALFFPEVISSVMFRRLSVQDFGLVNTYLSKRFDVFRNIAEFDNNGDLIITEKAKPKRRYRGSNAAYDSQFLRNE